MCLLQMVRQTTLQPRSCSTIRPIHILCPGLKLLPPQPKTHFGWAYWELQNTPTDYKGHRTRGDSVHWVRSQSSLLHINKISCSHHLPTICLRLHRESTHSSKDSHRVEGLQPRRDLSSG